MPRFVKENIEFKGIDFLPEYWKPYFVLSEIGKTYTVIRDTEVPILNNTNNSCKSCGNRIPDLIMSDTEYEYHTNQPFFDLCLEYTHPRVLSVGYGIGLIIPEMERQGVDLTILEKYQEILDLDENIDQVKQSHTIIIGDIKSFDLSQLDPFDVIFLDITENLPWAEVQALKSNLKPGGQLKLWSHDKKINDRKKILK